MEAPPPKTPEDDDDDDSPVLPFGLRRLEATKDHRDDKEPEERKPKEGLLKSLGIEDENVLPDAETFQEAAADDHEQPSDLGEIEQLSELDASEQLEVRQQIAQAELQDLQVAQQEGQPNAAEDQAVETFYEELAEDGDIDRATAAALGNSEVSPQDTSAEAEDAADPNQTTGPAQPAPIPPRPTGPPPTSRRPGPNQQPPSPSGPPAPPIFPPLPPRFNAAPAPGPGPQQNFNAVPATQQTTNQNTLYRSHAGGAFLLGGIVGFLYGRRRGRIKTERLLLPVQKRLEKQVKNLDFEVKQQELKIRKIARERQQSIPLQQSSERIVEVPLRQVAPEANQLHGKKAPEQIGKLLVTAESLANKSEQKVAAPSAERGSIDKYVQTLSRQELLEISSKIQIEGSSLRQIYETNLVSETSLRRVVTEYLRGGDVAGQLHKEIVERDVHFEKDPLLRDQDGSGTNGGGVETSLQTLVDRAEQLLPGTNADQHTTASQRAAAEEAQAKQYNRNRAIADGAMATVIVTLVAVIIYLLMR